MAIEIDTDRLGSAAPRADVGGLREDHEARADYDGPDGDAVVAWADAAGPATRLARGPGRDGSLSWSVAVSLAAHGAVFLALWGLGPVGARAPVRAVDAGDPAANVETTFGVEQPDAAAAVMASAELLPPDHWPHATRAAAVLVPPPAVMPDQPPPDDPFQQGAAALEVASERDVLLVTNVAPTLLGVPDAAAPPVPKFTAAPRPPTGATDTSATPTTSPAVHAVAAPLPVVARPPQVRPAADRRQRPRGTVDERGLPIPEYPPECRRAREQGLVVLHVRVTTRGTVDRVEVADDAGHPRLARAAADAVRRATFDPATSADGQPVPAWVTVPYRFVLR